MITEHSSDLSSRSASCPPHKQDVKKKCLCRSACAPRSHTKTNGTPPLKTKINSIPTNHRQVVGVVGFAFMIVFTGCTKHGREGRADSVCLGSHFKHQQTWRHPTLLIQPLKHLIRSGSFSRLNPLIVNQSIEPSFFLVFPPGRRLRWQLPPELGGALRPAHQRLGVRVWADHAAWGGGRGHRDGPGVRRGRAQRQHLPEHGGGLRATHEQVRCLGGWLSNERSFRWINNWKYNELKKLKQIESKQSIVYFLPETHCILSEMEMLFWS